jgi:hypothetical protein
MLNQVHTSNFVLLLLYLGGITNQRSITFGCIHLLLDQWHQVPSFLGVGGVCSVLTSDAEGSGFFITEKVDGVGGRRAGDNAAENFPDL